MNDPDPFRNAWWSAQVEDARRAQRINRWLAAFILVLLVIGVTAVVYGMSQ